MQAVLHDPVCAVQLADLAEFSLLCSGQVGTINGLHQLEWLLSGTEDSTVSACALTFSSPVA